VAGAGREAGMGRWGGREGMGEALREALPALGAETQSGARAGSQGGCELVTQPGGDRKSHVTVPATP